MFTQAVHQAVHGEVARHGCKTAPDADARRGLLHIGMRDGHNFRFAADTSHGALNVGGI